MKSVLIFSLVFLLASCGGGSSSSGANNGNPQGFSALLGATFSSPRCQNCHAFDAGNTFGQIHEQTGRSSRDCADCHFTPEWRAPFQSFSFAGLTDGEICVGIKNRSSNDLDVIRSELLTSSLARWAIIDGGLPIVDGNEDYVASFPAARAMPQSMAQFENLVDQWLAGGAACD